MSFFKKKSAEELRDELEKEEIKNIFLKDKLEKEKKRLKLIQEIKKLKTENIKAKYGGGIKFAKTIGKGLKSTGESLGGVLGDMAKNQEENKKKKKYEGFF